MLIGIDGNEANVEKRVGVGEYSFELLRQFSSAKRKAESAKFIIYLKDRPSKNLPGEIEWWQYRIIGPKRLWTQFALPLDLFFHRPRPDVFLSLTHYAPRFSPVSTVISIMDLSFIHFPEMFKKSDLYQLKNWTAYSVKKAKKVLTISQASKNDIIGYYKVESEKVVVTYPGVKVKTQMSKLKTTTQNLKLLKNKYGIEGDYILFVGTLQPRKNLVRLIEAFSRIIHPRGVLAGANHLNSLVIAGKKGWLYEEILEAPQKFGVEERVKFLDFIPDNELAVLYKNALCFILPSLYEGFGLPVLEAMSYGCPVITSNVSSLPEAGGDAAFYVDPNDVNDIAKNLALVVKDAELRKKMIEKGYEQVKKFSWEKTAKETLGVLKEVAKKHS